MDRREQNNKWYKSFNERDMVFIIDREAKEGEAIREEDEWYEMRIPAEYEVCGTCDGKGKHVNPSIDSQGLSREDFDDDPDFEEDYFAGKYDVTCNECNGKRVSPVVNWAALERKSKEDKKYVEEFIEEFYDYERTCYMERKLGC